MTAPEDTDFLSGAVAETKKWCAAPGVLVDGKPSDQYWMARFSPNRAGVLTEQEVGRFIKNFSLSIMVRWDKARVVAELRKFAETTLTDPLTDVPRFEERLRRCTNSQNARISAASKFAVFVHPYAQVFIWDSLARKSAKARDDSRGGLRRRANARTAAAPYDYEAYCEACARALDDERRRAAFQRAISSLDSHFLKLGGPMSDRERVPLHFIERRLLDKMMFLEGQAIKG